MTRRTLLHSVPAWSVIDSVYYTSRGEIRVVTLNCGSDRPAGEGDHVNIEEFIPITVTECPRQIVAATFDLPEKPLPLTRSAGIGTVSVPVSRAYAGVRLVLAAQ